MFLGSVALLLQGFRFPRNQLTLNDWRQGEVEGNIKTQGKQKNSLFPKGPVIILSELLYGKTKQNQILKNALRFQRQHPATFNCTV